MLRALRYVTRQHKGNRGKQSVHQIRHKREQTPPQRGEQTAYSERCGAPRTERGRRARGSDVVFAGLLAEGGHVELLGEEDVDRQVLAAVAVQQEAVLPPQHAVVAQVGQPGLALVQEDDAHGAEHHQTGQHAQDGEADGLALGEEGSALVELLHGHLQDAVLGLGHRQLVHPGGQAVGQPVPAGQTGDLLGARGALPAAEGARELGLAQTLVPHLGVLQAGAPVEARVGGAVAHGAAAGLVHEAGGAAAAEVAPDVGANALVLAWVRGAAVGHDLAEIA